MNSVSCIPKFIRMTYKNRHKYKLIVHRYLRYCYFILFKCLGIAPFRVLLSEVVNADNEETTVLYASYYGMSYNMVLVVIACAVNNYLSNLLPQLFTSEVYGSAVVPWTVAMGLIFVGNLTVISVWIHFIIWQKTIVAIANRLIYINKALKKYNNHNFEDENRDIGLFIITLSITVYLSVMELTEFNSYFALLYVVPSVLCCWLLLQYTIILILMTQIFRILNKTLLKFGSISTQIKFHILFVTKISIRQTIAMDIIIIRRIHKILCEICHEISNFFGFPVLLVVIYFSGSCIFISFFILITFLVNIPGMTNIIRINASSWLLMELFYLVVLTASVTKLTKEVRFNLLMSLYQLMIKHIFLKIFHRSREPLKLFIYY